jgi:hypothetical protein
MKTSVKTLSATILIVVSLQATAQKRSRGNDVQQTQQPQTQTGTDANERHLWASNNHGPSVSVHIGGYPNYGGNYYYGYNNYNSNYYSVKKAARNSIHQSASVIGQALQFSDWNDLYSPWLAKAIQHQQYAKQLYFWGDYAGALNHAERAGFLAWNTLSYSNNGYNGYNQYNYPNPYSDPNNPYYRQSNPGTGSQANNPNDNSGYRKNGPEDVQENTGSRKAGTQTNATLFKKTELDGTLPQSKLSDRELLKVNVKDLDIE